MKRILVSQNENNDGSDYLIVDGEIVNDNSKLVYYGRHFAKTDEWKEVYKDDFLEVRQEKNHLLLKSFYKNKDVIGRAIYYMYIVEETDNLDTILSFLEKDSKLINREFDNKQTKIIIDRINSNDRVKKKFTKLILVAVGIAILIALLSKIK